MGDAGLKNVLKDKRELMYFLHKILEERALLMYAQKYRALAENVWREYSRVGKIF